MRETPRPTGKRFEAVSVFELCAIEELSSEERDAVLSALEAQRGSTNPKWRVGATAVSESGVKVSTHNIDEQGHAEQRVLSMLYAAVQGPHKRLKIIALAGAQPGQEVIREGEPYGEHASLDDIEWMKPCAKCLEFIHDRTADVPDVEILSVAATGQVLRTSLRSLLPRPHTSVQVPIDTFMAPASGSHRKIESEEEKTETR